MKLYREPRLTEEGGTSVFIRGINRGMVFWADVPKPHTMGSEQYKRRPWLVVSSDTIHQRLALVLAVPLSTQGHKASDFARHRIVMELKDFSPNPDGAPLTEPSVALTEQVRALAHMRLEGEPAGRFSAEAMTRVDAGLRFVLRL